MPQTSSRLLCFFLIAALGLTGCAKTEKEAEEGSEVREPAPVQVAEVDRSEIRRVITADGVLYPLNQASITPKITAPIRVFHVNRGDHVKKGQVLAELESRDLAAAAAESKSLHEQAEASYRATTAGSLPEEINKAEHDVESARQALAAAQRLYESRQELYRQGALAQKLVDEANVSYVQAKTQYEVAQAHLESLQRVGRPETTKGAQAQIEAAKAKYEAAEVQLSYARIVSPIDGVVADRPLYAGETAKPETPLLTVMDVSRIVARAKISIADLRFVRVGDPAAIKVTDTSQEVQGRISVVSPALDPASTTVEVWAEAVNPRESLKPGAVVSVSMVVETINDAVVVPAEALLPSDEGKPIVMVVDSDSVAHEREVQVGIREQDKVQILEGVEPGEKVITVGGVGLEDNSKVKIE